MTNKTLRNTMGLASLSALALVMVACGGSSSSSTPAPASNQAPSAPVITASGLQITGHPLTFNLSAVDPEGDQITFLVTGANSTTVGPTNGSGSFTWTPAVQTTPSSQTLTVSVVARDSKSASSTASTFTWTEAPNHAPQFFSLSTPPVFTGVTPAFNVSYTVVSQDQDTDDVKFDALSAITVVDNNGAPVSATPSINATSGVVTWAGTVPSTAVSVTATFTVTAKDYLAGTSTAVGGSSTQLVTLTYNSGNLPPTIVTSSLPSLPANHYIPIKQGDLGFLIQADDVNAGDVLTITTEPGTDAGLSLVAGPTPRSKYLVSSTGFVPKISGGSFTVVIGVVDGHNAKVTKTLTIPVVADSVPALNSTPYTETVSGVNFFNTAKNKWDVTVPGSESPALRFPITNPDTARQRFYPGSVSWVPAAPYAATYTAGETFTGPTVAEVGGYDHAFSNYSAYPAGFLGALTDLTKASSGWNARTLFNDAEGDKVLYRLQGGSVFVAGTVLTTVGQTFTITGVDGATSNTTPVLGHMARQDEYPYVNADTGTINWRPVLFERANALVNLPHTGIDAWGTLLWSAPANWSFTVEALEKVFNPLGTGNAPGDLNYDLISSQKGVQNYTVKVQPNNRPVVGPLVTIPGGFTPVPGAAPNMVVNPSTTLVIGGGASINPLAYGRPSIQEPESRRYDIGAGTGFDYTQKNTVLPAVWRWLMARAGGNGTIAADVQIYDPDRTGQTGHQDTIVASMNALLASGIPGDPLPGDTSNNVPVLDASSQYYYNPWITAGDRGAFQVNWGPNRNQYLLARVAGTMNLTLPVDVRDQYQRQAQASARINPIFGTVRFTNHRQRYLLDNGTSNTAQLGLYYAYNGAGTFDDGTGHYGDNVVGGGAKRSQAVFTYLPFPSEDAVDETNFGATPSTATHLMDGTEPASGVSGSGASALYTAASWITLYATEAPQTGFHTGNPLNDETTRFNFTSYASALNGSSSTSTRVDWKTFGYTFVNGSNPTAPVEELRNATGSWTSHEYRAQVIPSNSPYLWGRPTHTVWSMYNAQGSGWSGNLNEAARKLTAPWFTLSTPAAWGPVGFIYGLYQGEIDVQSALPGRQNAISTLNTTTLRWAYSWPTQITNVNFKDTAAVGTVNKWERGDVMEIAVPNMGGNSRFFFTGDGAQNDSLASTIFGWGGIGMSSTVGIVDSEFVFGTGTLGATGYTIADNTPFHVPSNSIWVPNNRGGLFVTQHFNLPNRTTFSPGATATELSFTGRKGYMESSLAQNILVDPSYRFQDVPSSFSDLDNTFPGLINLGSGDNIYYFWLKQDGTYPTAWGTWDASKIIAGSTYTATGGLTTVPAFGMGNGATTSTYASLFSGAQVSLAGGALPGQNHASNIDVSTDAALYNSNIISPVGWARSQWGLLAPTVGYQPWSVPTNNVRLVNPKFNSTDLTTFNNTVASFRNLGGVGFVSTDGGFRDSATVYAIRNYANEQGVANAEKGLGAIMPGSPLLAQWYNLQLTSDPLLDGSMVIATALTDVDSKSWPDVFTFYSPFVGDPAWSNVMEFKMNYLVGMTYPNAAPVSLVKVPAVVANVFPLGAPVTDPSCTNPGNTINPGNPIVRSIQTFQINDYWSNYTGSGRVQSIMDLSNSNPTNPVTGAGAIVTSGSNTYIQAMSNVTLKWQASVNNQVLPSGYYVELFQLTSIAGTDVNTPILLATFRTGHIGGKDAVQVMHLPSMHSFSGRHGSAGVGTEAVYFFKVRTLWYSGIQMEKTPLKMSVPMAYADYISSPFVTQ